MTKYTLLLAVGVAAISAPAFAQYSNQNSVDPCLLGTNVQPGACVGPLRVAPVIMSQGSVQQSHVAPPVFQNPQVQQGYVIPNSAYDAPADVRAHTISYIQPPIYTQSSSYSGSSSYSRSSGYSQASVNTVPLQSTACVPGYVVSHVPCNGNWVLAPVPQYAPAPHYAPQPQLVVDIPTSFFTGGISYGAGFPIHNYGYGGGGGFFISGGGTRFSGVRERSPTPLVAPPMRHRPAPHRPPCSHCH
jgi:hypothetical protein